MSLGHLDGFANLCGLISQCLAEEKPSITTGSYERGNPGLRPPVSIVAAATIAEATGGYLHEIQHKKNKRPGKKERQHRERKNMACPKDQFQSGDSNDKTLSPNMGGSSHSTRQSSGVTTGTPPSAYTPPGVSTPPTRQYSLGSPGLATPPPGLEAMPEKASFHQQAVAALHTEHQLRAQVEVAEAAERLTLCADTLEQSRRSRHMDDEDANCVMVVRKLRKLGLRAQDILQKYCSQYGEVVSVVVAASKVKGGHGEARSRPGSLGYVVMKNAGAVDKILAAGDEPTLANVSIKIQRFEPNSLRKDVDE